MKRINYRGGMLAFDLPDSYREEYYKDGGAAFFEYGQQETLNLTLTTLSRKGGISLHQLRSELSSRFSTHVVEELPSGNLLVRQETTDANHAPPLHLTLWTLHNIVPPDTLRYAVFGYAVAAADAGSDNHAATVCMLDGQIKAATFTTLSPFEIAALASKGKHPWWKLWK